MKKLLGAIIFSLMISATAFAGEINYNGEKIGETAEYNGLVMVPFRTAAEFIYGKDTTDKNLVWNDKEKSVSFMRSVYLKVDESNINIGRKYSIKNPVKIVDNRLMVPLETLSLMLGRKVQADSDGNINLGKTEFKVNSNPRFFAFECFKADEEGIKNAAKEYLDTDFTGFKFSAKDENGFDIYEKGNEKIKVKSEKGYIKYMDLERPMQKINDGEYTTYIDFNGLFKYYVKLKNIYSAADEFLPEVWEEYVFPEERIISTGESDGYVSLFGKNGEVYIGFDRDDSGRFKEYKNGYREKCRIEKYIYSENESLAHKKFISNKGYCLEKGKYKFNADYSFNFAWLKNTDTGSFNYLFEKNIEVN